MPKPVGVHSIIPDSTSYCGYCHDDSPKSLTKEWIAHDGPEGEKHPYHKDCLESWVKIRQTCPTCFVDIDASSFLTWQEKTVIWLKSVNKLRDSATEEAINTSKEISMGIAAGSLVALVSSMVARISKNLLQETVQGHLCVDIGPTLIAASVTGIAATVLAKQLPNNSRYKENLVLIATGCATWLTASEC